ncbi:hypothetical protein ATO10_12589 [Actibacterium atlanticum]|uniref:AB hydrolase-1 domain-containing protein n=1 Tax=Actibacterium atlanticum TaxID=1461693 RepID=A0A058ZJP1_9RHOB|nr:hypothetical protein [Actibacterium atlanticum]KCV81445.1 hypothetical protein ATO10_12589 [Actibacterium atlanticum]
MTTEDIGWGAKLEYGDPDHLVAFVSGWGQPGNQNFHFQPFANTLSQTKLFLRDHANCHYTKGIQGVTENEEESVEFLKYLLDKIGPKRVSFISGSLGSHATVLWGHKLGVDDIHLIGPVTDLMLGIEQERAYHPAFAESAKVAQQMVDEGYEYVNLREFMQANTDKVDCVDLYYGLDDQMDIDQAGNVEDLPHVRSTVYHRGDHFRVPMFVQRRDPVMSDRINADHVDKPKELRRARKTDPIELGYASVKLL